MIRVNLNVLYLTLAVFIATMLVALSEAIIQFIALCP